MQSAEFVDQERKVVQGPAQAGRLQGKGGPDFQRLRGRGKSSVGRKGGKAGSYADWTVPQLKKRAKELGMSGYSSLTKDKLVAKLRNH